MPRGSSVVKKLLYMISIARAFFECVYQGAENFTCARIIAFRKIFCKKTAELLLFSSAAHFRRLFVKCCGQSPLKWKKEKMACDVVKYEGFRGGHC